MALIKFEELSDNIEMSELNFSFTIQESDKNKVLKFLLWLKQNYFKFIDKFYYLEVETVYLKFVKTNSIYILDYNELCHFVDGYKSALLE